MKAYEYFLRYAAIPTTSVGESETCPSSAGQWDLARLLAADLKAVGLADAEVDKNCYVTAALPATEGMEDAPAVGFIAHMDTSSDAPGDPVRPLLHPDYDGGTVVLSEGILLEPERFPFLAGLKGETLITSDGTTLLGADDKAGAAEIMAALETLRNTGRPHGKVCVAFTPDEEISRGTDRFPLERFGAAFAYTVDGGDVGTIEYENFNAASAEVKIRGIPAHTGSAKNTMLHALNVAVEFHDAVPRFERAEHTEGREGFYHLARMAGDVSSAELLYLLRDHDAGLLEEKKETLRLIARRLNDRHGAGTVRLDIRDTYFNMIEKIRPHFHLVETARRAVRMAGLTPEENPVRGGTDGAALSWKGLPCPNLGTGGFNFHSCFECVTAERMEKAAEILLNIIALRKQG